MAISVSAAEMIMPTSFVSGYSYEREEGKSTSFQLFNQARQKTDDGTIIRKPTFAGIRKATIYKTHMLVTDEKDNPIELIPFDKLISVKFITEEELKSALSNFKKE